jgi:2,5-diketo-D-gluconate reductase A
MASTEKDLTESSPSGAFNQEVESRRIIADFGSVHEGWAPFVEGNHRIFTNQVRNRIAENHGKTIEPVALRWHIQEGNCGHA